MDAATVLLAKQIYDRIILDHIDGFKRRFEFESELVKHGFVCKGNGSQKRAYAKNGVVVKLDGTRVQDTAAAFIDAVAKMPESKRKFFAKTEAYFQMTIQEEMVKVAETSWRWCLPGKRSEAAFERFREIIEESCNVFDVHGQNMGINAKGEIRIFDFHANRRQFF